MPYVHRTVVCGETVEHRKMYSSRVHSKEVKPRKRSSERETSKCQERINERVAEEHLRWLINCNYHYGDFHLVLHYWCKTITLEQAERDRAAFFRELRKAYAKAGKRLKYIAVLETKHMTNVHHHILLPRFDAQIIAAAWTKVTNGAGSISFQMLDDRKNHAKLASYLIKESRSTMRRCHEQGIRAGGTPAVPAWQSRRSAIRWRRPRRGEKSRRPDGGCISIALTMGRSIRAAGTN